MSQNITREYLLESFKALQGKFDESLDEAKSFEVEFEKIRKNFKAGLTSHTGAARNGLADDNPLTPQISAFIDLLAKTNGEWDAKVAGREKGVRFRKDFQDSLLVFVNGKVKSGKSSLGNYIAWGNTDPVAQLKVNTPMELAPSYFTNESSGVDDSDGGDAQNEAATHREFRVGATEATSSIQGFKLPGLTWVDSPGLHSVRKENEALARKYVEHADLILYTMKSDSPGRESDLSEIKNLVGKGKRVIILLTGSDDVEEDWDDITDSLKQVVIMKDEPRCKRQRDYVRDELGKMFSVEQLETIQILSFSARYAQLNSHEQQFFWDSGMGQLCEVLHGVAQSEGVQIKRQTPLKNLLAFLSGCQTDLAPLKELIPGLEQSLHSLNSNIERNIENHIRSGQSELVGYIDNFFDGFGSQHCNQEEADQALRSFQEKLNAEYMKVIENKLGKMFQEILLGFQETITSTYSNSKLLTLPGFKLEQIEEQIAETRSGTKKKTGIMGTVLGAAAGFILGGPVGAMAGASLGGAAGGMVGRSAEVAYSFRTTIIGDNLPEIQQKAITSSRYAFEEQIRSSTIRLLEVMKQDVNTLLHNINKEITDFELHIEQLKKNIQRGC